MASSKYQELLGQAYRTTGGKGAVFSQGEDGKTYVEEYAGTGKKNKTVFTPPQIEEPQKNSKFDELVSAAYEVTGGKGAVFSHDDEGNAYYEMWEPKSKTASEIVDEQTEATKAENNTETGEKPSLWQRIKNFFTGDRAKNVTEAAASGTASGFVGGMRALWEAGQGGRDRENQQLLSEWETSLERAQRDLDYLLEESGGEETGDVISQRYIIEDLQRKVDAMRTVVEGNVQQKATEATKELTHDLEARTQEATEAAKAGTGKVGSFAVDAAINMLQMGGDAVVGLATGGNNLIPMGFRVFGQSASQAEQAGADLSKQLGYGTVSAGIEIFTEKLFDGVAGIYGKGSADEVTARLIRRLAKTPAGRTAVRTILGMIEEGGEEVISDLLAPAAQVIYSGQSLGESYAENLSAEDVLYDFLIGAAVSGGMNAVSTVNPVPGMNSIAQNRAENAQLAQVDEIVRAYQDQGVSAKQADPLAWATQKIIKGEELSRRDQRFYDASPVSQQVTEQVRTARESAAEKVTGTGYVEQVIKNLGASDEAASVLMEGYKAGTASAEDYALGIRDAYKLGEMGLSLEQATRNAKQGAALNEAQFRHAWSLGRGIQTAEANAVDVKTPEGREKLSASLASLGVHSEKATEVYDAGQDSSRYAAAMSKAVALYAASGADLQAIYEAAKSGKTSDIISYLTPVQIEAAAEIGAQIRAENRTALKASGAKYQEIRKQAAAVLAQEATNAQALANVNKAIQAAKQYGQQEQDAFKERLAELEAMVAADPDAQNTDAYNKAYDEALEHRQNVEKTLKGIEELEEKRKELQEKQPVKRKKGTVSFDGGEIDGKPVKGVDREKLTRQQKNVVAMVEALADAVNIDYVFFDGDAKGTQGAYIQGGTVYVNINSGMAANKTLAAATLSHELTHYLQEYAPEEYQELKDFIVQEILKKSPEQFDALVKQQLRLEPDLSYDQAVDEIVANACQTMLLDSKAVTELARKNMNLAEKVVDVLDDLTAKIKAAFEEVNTSDNIALFNAVKAVDGEMDRIRELWDKALTAATENYNAVQAVKKGEASDRAGSEASPGALAESESSKKTAPESGVQYSKAEQEEILHLKEQVRENLDRLNKKPIVSAVGTKLTFDEKNIQAAVNWICQKIGAPRTVNRKGFGPVEFTRKRINRAFNYLPGRKGSAARQKLGQAFMVACAAAPDVVEHGQIIEHHKNHKNYGYPTWTFAAPVKLNGERGILAVVIKRTTGNFYDVHSILTPDGDLMVLDTNNKAEASDGGVLGNKAVAPSKLSAENSVAEIAEAVKENDAPTVAESTTQYQKWEGDLPERTQYGFKLMNVDENGLPHAMFIDAANPYELGQWYTADSPKMENLIKLEPGYAYLVDENDEADMKSRRPVRRERGSFRGLPGKAAINQATEEGKRWMVVDQYADGSKSVHNVGINGSGGVSTFALRPGIHAVDIPSMSHIGSKSDGSAKIDTRRPNQRWFLIEYPVDVDYNQEAYHHETKDIREHLPAKGWYSYQTNSGAEARQHWFITGGMKVVGAISEADARRYAKERGFEADLPWKNGKSYSEDDAIDLDEYIRTTKAQPTPSKEEMRKRIEAGETDSRRSQFSMWADTEETDRLIAVHNKSVSGLKRMLARNGVPFPSIAIKKAGTSHEGFGDVSIVFPRSSIDPQVNRQNRLYSNDAWTPTEPRTEFEVDVPWKLKQKLEKVVGEKIFQALNGYSYLDDGEVAKALADSTGNIFEALKRRNVIKYAYLKSIGQAPEVTEREAALDGSHKYKNSQLIYLFEHIPIEEIESANWDSTETLQKIADALNEQFESQFADDETKKKVRRMKVYTPEKISIGYIKSALLRYQENGNSAGTELDTDALSRALMGNTEVENDPGFKEWVEKTFGGIVKGSGIPNGKDPYTDSGNRRSFKQTHVPATLENIVKQMQKEQERGNGLFGINLRGAATKAYGTVEEMRADRGKLLGTHISDDVYDSYMKGFYERLHTITGQAATSERWETIDSTEEILLEALRDANSKAQMDRLLRKEAQWIKIYPELTEELWQLKQDVQNMPAPYFEAKPRRIVYPEEALAYILPDNADPLVLKALEDRHYNVLTYKAGDEQDRLAKLNSVEGSQFQVWDNTTDDTAAESNGRELAYTRLQAENAILSETVKSLRRLTDKQSRTIERLQERLHLTKTQEVRESDARKLAAQLIREAGSTADKAGIAEQLKALGDYILQTPAAELDEAQLKAKARNIASEILENAQETFDVDAGLYQEIKESIRGRKLTIRPEFLGELDVAGGFDSFRKRNFGKFTLARSDSESINRSEYMTVDQFYTDIAAQYPGLLPQPGEDTAKNEGDYIQILASMFDAGDPLTVNPYDDYMGEASEELANRIVFDALDGIMRPTAPTDADRAKSRREALQQQIQELKAQEKLDEKTEKDLVRTVYDLTLALDKAESKYRSLRAEADYRTNQVREEGVARAAEVKAKERERAAEKIQALKEHYQDVTKRARERREESAGITKYRAQVQKKAGKLYEMLMKNDDKLHVPEVLKAPLAEFLSEIDFSSKRILSGGAETRNDQAFGARLMRLQQLLSNQQDYINGTGEMKEDLGGYIDVSPDSLEFLKNTAQLITQALGEGQSYTINRMNAAQLKDLSNFLSSISSAIRNMNHFMANARFESVREAASQDADYMKELGRAKESAGNRYRNALVWKNGVPYYIFKRFGAGGQSIFEGFTKGWEKMAFNAQEIIDFTEKTYTDKEVREWKKQEHEITLSDGNKITMTTAQIMELSMLLNREQALKHIEKGGVRIGDIETKKGKKHDTAHYHLSYSDIMQITGKLTERQQAVAKALQQYMAVKGAEWGNEISMRRFGYNFYVEGENYYPIRTDSNDRAMADTDAQTNSMFRLLNLSSSKALNPKASNALIVGDIFDTFADHMADMAKLNGMGLPILDAIKWFNYKERIDNEDGTYDTRTLQAAMEEAFGGQAQHYFRTLMKDINGVTESGDRGADVLSGLMGNFKAASVGANLRVALLQPTSYIRALTVLKPQYLAAAFAHKNAYQEAMKYSGSAVWKSLGYYDTDISKGMRGQIQHNDSVRDKIVEASMKGAELGDKLTWGRLWIACKLQVRAQNRSLSGDALMQATADLFREVIYSSQVMDSTLTRSEWMRSKSNFDKLFTPFMAEPTLSYNILLDAASSLSLDERRYGKAEAWQRNAGKIGHAYIVYLASAAFNALAESIWDAVRDPDDNEEFWEKFLQALFGEDSPLEGNLLQDILITNKLPLFKDLWSMLSGYSSSNIATDSIRNIYNAAQIWWETYQLSTGAIEKATKITSYGKMTPWGKIYKTLQGLSQLTGVPMSGFTRDALAIWNTIMNGRKDEWKIKTYGGSSLSTAALEGFEEYVQSTGLSKKQYTKILDDADANGGSSPTQDELGTYLMAELDAGNLTEDQAQGLWKSRGWSEKHDFNWWRSKNGAAVPESTAPATETAAPKAASTKAVPFTPAASRATEPASSGVTDFEGFKSAAPIYGNEKKAATYSVWESSLRQSGMTLERFTEILGNADTDGNDSLKQDELGYALRAAINNGEMSFDQASAVWNAQGWSAKHGFGWWSGKH